jgi:ribosomal protein S2
MNKNENFCLEKLIELKFHLGHETYSNRISPYILGLREGVSILDLEQRYSLLRRGLIVINELQQRQSTV